jgi:hypothetical protein
MFKTPYIGLQDILKVYFQRSGFQVALLQNSNGLTEQSTMIDFLSRELLEIQGYSRRPISFAEAEDTPGNDLVAKAVKFPEQRVTFLAGATLPLQFDGIALIYGAKVTGNFKITAISNGSDLGPVPILLAVGDQVFFTNALNDVPTGLNLTTVYFVREIAADRSWFRVAATAAGANLTGLGSTWTGDLIARLAAGVIVNWEQRSPDGLGDRTFTIQQSQSHTIRVDLGIKAEA